MLRFLFVFALAFLFGCVEFDRDNPLDPGSPKYPVETAPSSGSQEPSSVSQERSSVSQEQSSSSVAPRDVPSSSSAVPSSGSQERSSVSQGQSSGSQEQSSSSSVPSSGSLGQSSSSSVPSSVSQGQSSSSSAPSSSSSAQSSSSLASSSSAIPDPIATGEIAFKNFDFSVGGSYYIGTNVTIGDNIASTVAVGNADDAGCGDVKIELSGCGAPGTVTTANANCTITAKAVVTCIKKHELKTATATVVPNPSLNGSCVWDAKKNAFMGGTTANVTAEPELQNVYGRTCDGPYFSVGSERKSDVFAGLMVDEWSGNVSATMSGITIGATCAGKAVTAINCPNIEVLGMFDDRDNQAYRIVRIGTQVWMAENLNFNTTGSTCYNNAPANCDTYGRLYNWATAMTACPSGWHLSSDDEWTILTDYVGSSTAGTKLKANSNWNGTDDYRFSALPGGYGNSDGSFYSVGILGYWWSATEGTANSAYARLMNSNGSGVGWVNYSKSNLYFVRCVQN